MIYQFILPIPILLEPDIKQIRQNNSHLAKLKPVHISVDLSCNKMLSETIDYLQ